ncbi:hypothetical protein F5Y18DRAFT_444082 [Xylariaceae sp. FL1019]|nr:hypothetical protein F5Y18DRAFT_444082 [Xylariaceae sp. FL1019]
MTDSIINCVSVRSRLGLDYRWGLYVYRTTFDDQGLWNRYMDYVHSAVTTRIKNSYYRAQSDPDVVEKVSSSFQLRAKEDKSLENLSYTQVRENYRQWIAAGEADQDWGTGGGMFQRIEESRARKNEPVDYFKEDVPLMIVDGQPVMPPDEDDDSYSKFEGDPADEDAGKEWQIVPAFYLMDFVDFHRGDGEAWYTFYKAPPAQWRAGS